MAKRRPETIPVPCPRCHGCGTVELVGVHAETLALLRAQAVERNGAALARLAGVAPTAMNNRLIVLERLGLATGRQAGRQRLWRAVGP